MTNPDGSAGQSPASETGTEPAAGGYEAPPIEQSQHQPGPAQMQPSYTPPPTYDAPQSMPPEAAPPTYSAGSDYPPALDYPAYPTPDEGSQYGYPAPMDPYAPPGGGYPPPPGAYPPPTPPLGAYPPPPGAYPAPGGFQAPGGYPGAMPGYPGGYPYGAVAPNNRMAIASLVSSAVSVALTSACGIGFATGLVGVVLGIISLNQIKSTGEQGRGMAIGGIVLGALLALVGVIILMMIVIFAASDTSSSTY